MDCKLQIKQLTNQINNIFATLDQTGPNAPKEYCLPPIKRTQSTVLQQKVLYYHVSIKKSFSNSLQWNKFS